MNSGIYKIVAPNGYYYYGSTKNFNVRKRQHFNFLKNNKHSNPRMQNCFNAYPEGWIFEIVERVHESDLLLAEQKYLTTYKQDQACMNINPDATLPPNTKGRPGPNKGLKMNEEYCIERRGWKHTEETKKLLRGRQSPNKGKPGTMLGRKLSSVSITLRTLSRICSGYSNKASFDKKELFEVIKSSKITDDQLNIALVHLVY